MSWASEAIEGPTKEGRLCPCGECQEGLAMLQRNAIEEAARRARDAGASIEVQRAILGMLVGTEGAP